MKISKIHILVMVSLLALSACSKPDEAFADLIQRMEDVDGKVEAINKREKVCALDDDVLKLSATINAGLAEEKNEIETVLASNSKTFPDGMKPTEDQIEKFNSINMKLKENGALMAAKILKSYDVCMGDTLGAINEAAAAIDAYGQSAAEEMENASAEAAANTTDGLSEESEFGTSE